MLTAMPNCLLQRRNSPRSSNHVKGKSILVLIFSLIFSNLIYAQSTVTGKVSSGDSVLAGVTVQVKGSTATTQTAENGTFSISASPTSTLVFTAVGFTPQEVRVNNRMTLDVSLVSTATQLGEVVVVGYGTQRRQDVTGSVSILIIKQQKKQLQLPRGFLSYLKSIFYSGISMPRNMDMDGVVMKTVLM